MGEDRGGGREEIITILEDDRRGKAWIKRLQNRRRLRELEREEGEEGKETDDDRNMNE